MSSKTRKIAVVGSRSVGKSSITVRYVENHFVESYYPTIENQFSKTVTYKGQTYAIEILDTAGQDEFSIVNQKHLIGIHGFVLVYSITSKESFELIRIIRDKILNSIGVDEIPFVLVGNKSDLSLQRQVLKKEGQDLAVEFGCKFVETSARENENLDKAFFCLIEEIEKAQNPHTSAQAEKCVIM